MNLSVVRQPQPLPPGPSRLTGRLAASGLALLALLLCGALNVAGQSATGRIEGTVGTLDGPPLANARVTIVGTGPGTITARDGRFSLAAVPAGHQIVEISFIGRETARTEVHVIAGATQRLELVLAVEAVPLPPVEATARPSDMEGFAARRAGGAGFFFTGEEIAAMQAHSFTDILRRVPGATVQNLPGGYGGRQAVQMGRTTGVAGARPCEAIYYVNGQVFPISTDLGINGFIRPHEIAAVEVYSGSSRVPPRFAAGQNSRCGVIVVWTHAGPPG